MLKLLIADDESYARHGLRNCVDWANWGVEVCGEVINGREALAFLGENEVDIIISDVRMPFMDGIELLNQLVLNGHPARFIFISGYDDLDYVKSALRLGADAYILKPVNVAELEKMVRRAVAKIHAERSRAGLQRQMQLKLEESMPLLRRQFLLGLLRGDQTPTGDALRDRLGYLDIPLAPCTSYDLLVVHLLYTQLPEVEQYSLTLAAEEMLATLLAERGIAHYLMQTDSNELVMLLSGAESAQPTNADLIDLAETVLEQINTRLSVDADIGLGSQAASLPALAQSYRVARSALEQAFYTGHNQVLGADAANYVRRQTPQWDAPEPLAQALASGDLAKVDELMEGTRAMVVEARLDTEQVYGLYRRTLVVVLTTLYDSNLGGHPLVERAILLAGGLAEPVTLEECHAQVMQLLQAVCDAVQESRLSGRAAIVEHIRKVIHARYAENLTIAEIAEAVSFSSAYISLLFRQETGQTINEYITEYRMETAKRMLRDPGLRLYQIAERVGYSDTRHFGRLFRRYTGKTPSEYRN